MGFFSKHARESTSPAYQPLFNDTNNNGVLDGAEIVAALNKEDIIGQPDLSAINKPGHGVFYVTNIVSLKDSWNADLKEGPNRLDEAKSFYADSLETNLVWAVDHYLEIIHDDPDYDEKFYKQVKSQRISKEVKQLLIAEHQQFAEFAKHFHKDFPSGVDVKPEDSVNILKHFGPIDLGIQQFV